MSYKKSVIELKSNIHHLKSLDLYTVYQAFTATAGEQEAFLFESITGPVEDQKFSLLGCHKLFELSFFGRRLQIVGAVQPVQLISQVLLDNHLIIEDAQGYALQDEIEIWVFLKALHLLFKREDHDINRPEFSSGFLATFAYEFSWRIEELPTIIIKEEEASPDIVLAFFQSILYFDYEKKILYHTSNTLNCEHPIFSLEHLDVTRAQLPVVESSAYTATDSISRSIFLDWVEQALEYIRAGDIYQVQLGHDIKIATDIPVQVVYDRLRQQNPSPYMFLSPCHYQILVGASPELFVRKKNQAFMMRPIAGTVKRSSDEAENRALIEKLKADEKERAEHLMLVDLCRNDMGRICKPGSLTVNDLMSVAQYSHVSHLVSTVSAVLEEGNDIYDILKATFPAGTMSGAPKVRALEIIESLEQSRRNYYAGTAGFIDLSGDAVLALMIRMAIYRNNQYHVRASAGIVIDSVPESEWLETLNKMSAPYKAITGKELTRENFVN